MQTLEATEICTLAEFRQEAEEHANRVLETRQPLILTANGKPNLVLLDAESYGQMLEAIDYAEAVEGIRQGLEDVAQGRTRPAAEFFAEMRRKYNLPETPLVEAIDYVEAVEGIRRGLGSKRQGKGRPAEESLEEMRKITSQTFLPRSGI